jgi:hypothetical protein
MSAGTPPAKRNPGVSVPLSQRAKRESGRSELLETARRNDQPHRLRGPDALSVIYVGARVRPDRSGRRDLSSLCELYAQEANWIS